jgi:tetratricopeptide (TPR) repeat protein
VSAVIEYLESLVAQKEYSQALAYAEELLKNTENSIKELMKIYTAMFQSRYFLKDYQGAAEAGQLLRTAAEETSQWDAYGEACINVSTAYAALMLPERALSALYDYLAHLKDYREASRFEAMALRNIGVVQFSLDQDSEAETAFLRTLDVTSRTGEKRQAFAARMALIEVFLKTGKLGEIPGLIAKCSHYIRHSTDERVAGGKVFLCKFRAMYAMATGRVHRAMLVTLRGYRGTDEYPHHQHDFHMLLAKMALLNGNITEALGHGLAARTYAAASHRADLEGQANDFLGRLSAEHPGAMEMVDPYFLQLEPLG